MQLWSYVSNNFQCIQGKFLIFLNYLSSHYDYLTYAIKVAKVNNFQTEHLVLCDLNIPRPIFPTKYPVAFIFLTQISHMPKTPNRTFKLVEFVIH